MKYDKLIVGGGIVGLATGLAIKMREPDCKLAILEKESAWASHQSSRNSGVIHAGVYYQPGSKKAAFARAGNASMIEFCERHDIPHEQCGKLIVATYKHQLPALEALHQRALANGLEVRAITREEVLEIEPHVQAISGLKVPSTGIVDYARVAQKYAELLQKQDVDLFLDHEVKGFKAITSGYLIATEQTTFETKYLISTTGLYSDRIATLAGSEPDMRIIPFRGEYYHLRDEKRDLVKNLIYPVPNPNFPFLGVHMTRLIDGSIHAGPNAVLALAREGYGWRNINLRDTAETLLYPGFWKLAGRYLGEGTKEMVRSLVKRAFVKSVQELLPEIQSADLVRGEAGVRAQALHRNGQLVDDFKLIHSERATFVLNAPSPAATASLEIGQYIADQIASHPS